MSPVVAAVNRDRAHRFSKPSVEVIRLVAGHGVEGDAHAGVTVQHLSRIRTDPTKPNLRQVHLIPAELHDELRTQGFTVGAGQMGENVTTRGIDLLGLSRGTLLRLGAVAVVEVTGLRTPCNQLNTFSDGLLGAVLGRDEHGEVVRRAGIMGVVVHSGHVRPGDAIVVDRPAGLHVPLEPV